MKIIFVMGGALTARQESVIELASMQHDVTYDRSLPDGEYDLLVYGPGVAGASDLDSSIAFSEYAESLEVEETEKKSDGRKESTIVASSEEL